MLLAVLCTLPADAPPPQAADDALEAAWVPLAEIDHRPCSAGVAELASLAHTRRKG